jgi:hypothetical protein
MLIFILLASESLPLLRFRFSSRSFWIVAATLSLADWSDRFSEERECLSLSCSWLDPKNWVNDELHRITKEQ